MTHTCGGEAVCVPCVEEWNTTARTYTPLPARRHSTDLIDSHAWRPDDPAKQRKAALNVIAWFGYPDAGTQAWDEAVEVLDMCGIPEGLR